MARVVVLCSDLMTGSRFVSEMHEVTVARGVERAEGVLADADALVVDLADFANAIEPLREAFPAVPVAGFAPHVLTDLIRAAQRTCDVVIARGAAVGKFDELVSRLLQRG